MTLGPSNKIWVIGLGRDVRAAAKLCHLRQANPQELFILQPASSPYTNSHIQPSLGSMSTAKANNYLQLLDAARCNGEWEGVPELCRKVQKHAPGRKCLSLTASTEARLYRLLHPGPEAASAALNSYGVTLKALQDPLQTELDCHQNVPKLPSPAGGGQSMVVTSDDILQARTILSWICSLKGDWQSALRLVPGEEEVGEGWSPGNGGKGDYISVIRIKALVLKGIAIAHIHPDDPSLPLQLYRAATKLPATYPQTQQASASFLLWTEKALSHHALAAYRCWLDNQLPPGTALQSPRTSRRVPGEWREGDDIPEEEHEETQEEEVGMAIGKTNIEEDSVARAFRAFHNFVTGLVSAHQVQLAAGIVAAEKGLNPEKEQERREVYRNYFKFISLLLLPNGHPNRPIPRALPSKIVAGSTISAVPTPGPAPGNMASKAGTRDTLRAELKIVEHVYEEYLLRGLNFPKAIEYHEVIGEWVDLVVENWRVAGGSGDEAPPVVEILYRAATKTFHSPRILRHLFITLTATGNFPDAVRALDTYIDLIQRAKDRIAKGHIEKDFDDDKAILETAVEGIRVLCGLVDDGRKGMELAERIEKWIEEWRVRSEDVLAVVFRGIGIANATWARKTIDGETRPDIQTAAIKAFEKGLSYDPFDIDAWYGLALVQVEVGDVSSAMESTKKGLIILKYVADEEPEEAWDGKGDHKRRAVPLLHLLALIMSATEEFEGARQACADVFEVLGEDMAVFRGMGIGEKECVLEVRMTQIAIEEALDGAEVAVKMTDHLLDIYGRLFEAAQLDRGSQSVYENGQFDSSLSTLPITTNRKPRLLGGRRKKPLSVSVSSLPPGGLIGETGLSISGDKKRPKSGHQSVHQPTGLSSNPNAPQIQVTDVYGGSYQTDTLSKKSGRPSSVSGGTIRRMKSFSSMRSGKDHGSRVNIPDVPTPPLPSTTDTSSVERSPVGSVKDHHHPHMFHMLKMKLHKHQLQQMGVSSSPTEHLSQFGSTTSFMTTDSTVPPMDDSVEPLGREAPRAEDIPNNLSQSKLPYPIRALRSGITDEIGNDAKPRSIRRPKQLPEPKLHEEDEKRRALAALRQVWLFVGGLARRSRDFGGAAIALDEATKLVGFNGEGEADVLAERAFLAAEEGKRDLAIEYFNVAISLDVNHSLAIVGLSQVLFEIPTNSTPSSAPVPTDIPVDAVTRPSASPLKAAPVRSNNITEEESTVTSLAATNRALGLLEHVTNSNHGWDISEAWFALARAYELGGETGRARKALWRCVELEDARAVRAWRNIKPRII